MCRVEAQIASLSNLVQPSLDSHTLASNSWIAQPFFTAVTPSVFNLESIQLLLGANTGEPSGLSVAVYSGTRKPQTPIGFLSGQDPTSGGTYNFTSSGISLSPQTLYWIVLTANTPTSTGNFTWERSSNQSYFSRDGWTMGLSFFSSEDGFNWIQTTPYPMQFALYATAIPEPSSLIILGMGGSILFTSLARKSRSRALSQA
jgi:hypothetical protein